MFWYKYIVPIQENRSNLLKDSKQCPGELGKQPVEQGGMNEPSKTRDSSKHCTNLQEKLDLLLPPSLGPSEASWNQITRGINSTIHENRTEDYQKDAADNLVRTTGVRSKKSGNPEVRSRHSINIGKRAQESQALTTLTKGSNSSCSHSGEISNESNAGKGATVYPILNSTPNDLDGSITGEPNVNISGINLSEVIDKSMIILDGINSFGISDIGISTLMNCVVEDSNKSASKHIEIEFNLPGGSSPRLDEIANEASEANTHADSPTDLDGIEDDSEEDDLIKDRSYIPPADDNSDNYSEEDEEDYEELEDDQMLEGEEQLQGLHELSKSSKSFSSSFTASGNVAISEVNLQPEYSQGPTGKGKRHFCYYCHKMLLEIGRHLETVHREELLVKDILKYPKKSLQRRKAIEIVRKKGDGLYNRDANYNKGLLLTVRRMQIGKGKDAGDFINCPNCDRFYVKSNIRHHYRNCAGKPPMSSRTLLQEAKRKLQRIHPDASNKMRHRIIPILNNTSEVSLIIRYDRLIILYGNLLSIRHKELHQDNFIRAQLRLLGRFLMALKKIEKVVDDLASAFNPVLFEQVLSAVNVVAEFDDETQTYKKAYNASALGTALRKCAEILKVEYIISKEIAKKNIVEDFMIVFNAKFGVYVNKNVAETIKKREREKRIDLPSTGDIQVLNSFITKERDSAYAALKNEFSYKSWLRLSEMVLLHLIVFNRRRRGEMQFIQMPDFDNPTMLTETDELYQELSKDHKETANNYVRLLIRGKLNRPVPVLVDKKTMASMQLLKAHRIDACVAETNPYFFALPCKDNKIVRTLDACKLIRNTAEVCGAKNPKTLRCTELRKQLATKCAGMNLTEADVGHLSNFMGHQKDIHKGIYRQPTVAVDIIRMSTVLSEAQKTGCPTEQNLNSTLELNAEIQPLRAYTDSRMDQGNACKSFDIIDQSNDSDLNSPLYKNTPRSYSNKRKSSKDKDSEKESVPERRNCTRKIAWSHEEVRTIKALFGDNISMEKLPRNKEIMVVLEKYPCFRNRHVASMKTWLHNQIRNKRNRIKL